MSYRDKLLALGKSARRKSGGRRGGKAVKQAAAPGNRTARYVRVRIVVTDNEADLVEDSINALAAAERIFQRRGRLVRIHHDPETTDSIAVMDNSMVRHELSRAAEYGRQFGDDDFRPCVVPAPLPSMVAGAPTFGHIRALRGLSHVPILHQDGAVFDRAGEWDPETRMVFCPRSTYPPIPIRIPTLADAQAAAAELLRPFTDFPFKTESDVAALLALILTLVARHLVEGPTPAFMVLANSPGAGKGKLIETVVAIALGVHIGIMTPTDDDTEDRKQITACLEAGRSIIAFDNVRKFGGPVWDGLLTSRVWSARRLGTSEQLELPVNAVVTVTGNGCRLVGDAARRTLPIRLETTETSPELRTQFKYQLPDDVLARHAQFFIYALEILRFGLTLQDPAVTWGSFESWCQVIRRTVTAVKCDPCATRADVKESDETVTLLHLLFTTLLKLGAGDEWTASELIARSREERNDEGRIVRPADKALAEALAALCGDADRVTMQRVGTSLATHVDRWVELGSGSRAKLTTRNLDGRKRWKVVTEAAVVPPPVASGSDCTGHASHWATGSGIEPSVEAAGGGVEPDLTPLSTPSPAPGSCDAARTACPARG